MICQHNTRTLRLPFILQRQHNCTLQRIDDDRPVRRKRLLDKKPHSATLPLNPILDKFDFKYASWHAQSSPAHWSGVAASTARSPLPHTETPWWIHPPAGVARGRLKNALNHPSILWESPTPPLQSA